MWSARLLVPTATCSQNAWVALELSSLGLFAHRKIKVSAHRHQEPEGRGDKYHDVVVKAELGAVIVLLL